MRPQSLKEKEAKEPTCHKEDSVAYKSTEQELGKDNEAQ
jgi:hypothetical protein